MLRLLALVIASPILLPLLLVEAVQRHVRKSLHPYL